MHGTSYFLSVLNFSLPVHRFLIILLLYMLACIYINCFRVTIENYCWIVSLIKKAAKKKVFQASCQSFITILNYNRNIQFEDDFRVIYLSYISRMFCAKFGQIWTCNTCTCSSRISKLQAKSTTMGPFPLKGYMLVSLQYFTEGSRQNMAEAK